MGTCARKRPCARFLINLISRKILYAITLCRKLQVKQIVVVQQIVVQC